MLNNWNNVALRLIKERGVKQDKLAERYGVTAGAFNHWIKGRREPRFSTILQILHQLGLRSLSFDEQGNVIIDGQSFEDAIFCRPDGERHINEISTSACEIEEKAVSYPIFATRTEIECLPSVSPTHKLFMTGKTPIRGSGFWMKISTEAMSNTSGLSIPQDSFVLFDTAITPRDGSLALFQTPASPSLLFRQYQVEAGEKHIKGLNPKWPTVKLPKGAKCLGVAVELRLFFSGHKR